jgi:Spy/CpxP family protein refolding chaperone
MKKSLFTTISALSLGCLILACPTARAQDNAPSTNRPPAGANGQRARGANMAEAMKQQLGLSDDQVEKLKPVFKDQQEKMAALRADTTLSREDLMAKRKEIQDATSAKVKEILTPDQFTKWQQMVQNRMRGRRGPQGGQGGAGGPGADAQKPAAGAGGGGQQN